MKPKALKYITLRFNNKELTILTHYPEQPIKSVDIKYGNLYSIFVYIARIFRKR
jgi:hypothetical protein